MKKKIANSTYKRNIRKFLRRSDRLIEAIEAFGNRYFKNKKKRESIEMEVAELIDMGIQNHYELLLWCFKNGLDIKTVYEDTVNGSIR